MLLIWFSHETDKKPHRNPISGEVFPWRWKPLALPVAVSRKKAFASGIERSEPLTGRYQQEKASGILMSAE